MGSLISAEMLEGLTVRQRKIFEYITNYVRERGYGPTVREICKAFNFRSPNGAYCHLQALERKGLIRRQKRSSRSIQVPGLQDPPPVLPLAGVIAAGQPVGAFETNDVVDFSDLFDQPDLFVLQVRGDSMIEDQIADGDYVVVRKQSLARDGQIVVARVEGDDATLKRFYHEGKTVRLEPANSTMEPIIVPAQDVEIIGVVVGVIRKYV